MKIHAGVCSMILAVLSSSQVLAVPVDDSIVANPLNIVSGNSATFTAVAHENGVAPNGNLKTFNFFVQGNAPGYNSGNWTYLGKVNVSGTQATATYTWTPPLNPGPGVYTWEVTFQAWDDQNNWNGNASFYFYEYPRPQVVDLHAQDIWLRNQVTITGRAAEEYWEYYTSRFLRNGQWLVHLDLDRKCRYLWSRCERIIDLDTELVGHLVAPVTGNRQPRQPILHWR